MEMSALAILVPGLILGAIAWGAVGVLRSRGRERFTLATAVNFYAQVMIVGGVLAVLAGVAVLMKIAIAQIDTAYSYYTFTPAPTYLSVQQQQTQDIILAAMLVGVGLMVAGGHWFLSRFLTRTPEASPTWVTGGTLVALTVLSGLAAIVSVLVGGYTVLVYFIVGQQEGMTFGDMLGSAVVFLPAWVVLMAMLLRRARHHAAKTPTPMSPAAA